MSVRPGIQIKYKPVRTPTATQLSWVGSQGVINQRGWWPDLGTWPDAACANKGGAVLWGNRFVAVGSFANIGASARAGFAMWNRKTGVLLTDFTLAFTGGTPTALETDGTWLYLGGSFTAVAITIGSATVTTTGLTGLCRISYAGVVDTTWLPALSGGSGIVVIKYNRINASIYIAGASLFSVNGTTRNEVAEIPIASASPVVPTAWDPEPNGVVLAIEIDADNQKVYLGGNFTQLYGAAHVRLNRLTMTGAGAVDTWAPAPDAYVQCLALDPTSGYLFVGGTFANIGAAAVARNRAAGIDANGNAIAWNPNLNGQCNGIAVYRNIVVMGGTFTTVGGTGRNRLAAVGVDNALRVWDPNANGTVDQIILFDRTVYAIGEYTTIGTGLTSYAASVPYPIFTNTNTKYVAKTGSDGAAGTLGAPYLTIGFALAQLTAAFTFVVVLDSGTYGELLTITYAANEEGGLFAADGQVPVITQSRGAVPGTYGARATGRTKFSTGAAATFIYLSKQGNDGTGARGNAALPFLTPAGALGAAGRVANDTIQIQDSGVYGGIWAVGANAVTIQAAAGQTPILANTAAVAIHITMNANVTVNLYGVIVDETYSGAPGTMKCIQPSGNIDAYDCTFIGGAFENIGAHTVNVINCDFLKSSNEALIIGLATAFTMSNCHFGNCVLVNASVGVVCTEPSSATVASISNCTIENCQGALAAFQLIGNSGKIHTVTISGCIVQNNSGLPGPWKGFYVDVRGTSSNISVSNVLIDRVGSNGIYDISTLAGGAQKTYSAIVMTKCGQTDLLSTGGHAFYSLTNSLMSLINCVAIESAASGFFMSGATTSIQILDRCVSVNAGVSGFQVSQNGANGLVTLYSCLEGGSGSKTALDTSGSTGSVYVTNCIFQNDQSGTSGTYHLVTLEQHTITTGAPYTFSITPPNAGAFYSDKGVFYGSLGQVPLVKVASVTGQGMYSVTGAAYTLDEVTVGVLYFSYVYTTTVVTTATKPGGKATIIRDPLFLNAAVGGDENVGLSAVSSAIDYNVSSPSTQAYINAGVSNPLVLLSTSTKPFALDGLTFTGDLNFYDGVQIARNLAAAPFVSYCSFQGLGPQGLQVASGATVERSLFATNGIGLNISDAGCTINQCVGVQCDGAFIIVYAANNTVKRCTAFRCEYGQINLIAATDTVNQDNVYSGNYALDYQGAGPQTTSDIATIALGDSVSGSRRDPLYRTVKVAGVDLRLQTIEAGFPYDSPAKLLAHDGTDAGAYAFAYPPLVASWTLIDFATLGYNPHVIETMQEPVKPTEGNTFGLVTFSDAAGFKIKRVLTWEPTTPMPAAQALALIDLYTYGDGECQMSLDGGATFIPMRVIRSQQFTRTQLAGLYYTRDTVPEPVRSMVFIEST